MLIILYILIMLLLIYGLLFLIPIKIKVIINGLDSDDEILILFSTILDLVQYKLCIPYLKVLDGSVEFSELTTKAKFVNENKNLKTKNSGESYIFEKFKKRLQKIEDFSKYIALLRPMVYSLLQKIHMKNFRWTTEIGSSDAAVTGILTGMLWIIKGQFFSFIKEIFRIEDVFINIKPYFNKLIFKTELFCIISIKIGHIINVGIKIAYILILKGGELRGQSSNRSFNEDNNGKSKGYG